MLNELMNNIIKNTDVNIWKQRNVEILKNNFLVALKRYGLKEEILMNDLATIDRIEGDFAVCELLNGEMKDISLDSFKEKVSEGDIFNIEVSYKEGKQVITIGEKNEKEMEIRRRIILEKLNKIKNK